MSWPTAASAQAIERLVEIVREELNVRQVRFVEAAEELGEYELKANYRTLGPLFGKDMPLAAKAIAALDPARVWRVRRARRGTRIGISVGDREHTLTEQDVILTMKAPEGYSVEREGAHAVALDLTIDDSLLREGRSREIVHAVQNARKTAGLEVEDRIELVLGGDAALLEAAREHEAYVSGETLAVSLVLGDGDAVRDGLSRADRNRRAPARDRSQSRAGWLIKKRCPACARGASTLLLDLPTPPQAPRQARTRSSSSGRPRRPS